VAFIFDYWLLAIGLLFSLPTANGLIIRTYPVPNSPLRIPQSSCCHRFCHHSHKLDRRFRCRCNCHLVRSFRICRSWGRCFL